MDLRTCIYRATNLQCQLDRCNQSLLHGSGLIHKAGQEISVDSRLLDSMLPCPDKRVPGQGTMVTHGRTRFTSQKGYHEL